MHGRMVFKMKNWKQKEFGQFVNLRKDKYQPTPGQSIPCVELECITKNSGEITHTISSETLSSIKNHFSKGDVLFGKLRPYLRKYALPQHDGICSTEIWVLHPKEGFCSPEFLFLLIQSNKFIYTANLSCGSRMPRADWDLVSSTPFLLPELPEQQKIVEVLETWDKAITLTKQLIEQKELQKKYLMQQLLTGHARLTGFTGKWKLLPLSKILKERKEYQTKNQELPHLSLTKEGVLPKTERYNRDFLVKDEDKLYKITHENDICYNPANLKFGVICRNQYGSGIFSPIYVTYEVTKYNSGFVGYLLTLPSSIAQARRFEEGTVYERMAVSSEDFLKVKLPFPTCEEESSQISIVIRKAEEEIYLLKQKLAKLEEQKKGLMQVLLTGKVRLVK